VKLLKVVPPGLEPGNVTIDIIDFTEYLIKGRAECPAFHTNINHFKIRLSTFFARFRLLYIIV